MGWGNLNLLATVGSGIIALSVLLFVINMIMSVRSGAIAGPTPWNAPSLEWAAPSPPPPWNFAELPTVHGRHPMWEDPESSAVVVGLPTDRRELLVTSVLDAHPESRHPHPVETIWPLLMALAVGVTFIGAVFTPWAYVVGFLLASGTFFGWAWPNLRHNADPRVKGKSVEKPA
jgi:hypothetical protein